MNKKMVKGLNNMKNYRIIKASDNNSYNLIDRKGNVIDNITTPKYYIAKRLFIEFINNKHYVNKDLIGV